MPPIPTAHGPTFPSASRSMLLSLIRAAGCPAAFGPSQDGCTSCSDASYPPNRRKRVEVQAVLLSPFDGLRRVPGQGEEQPALGN